LQADEFVNDLAGEYLEVRCSLQIHAAQAGKGPVERNGRDSVNGALVSTGSFHTIKNVQPAIQVLFHHFRNDSRRMLKVRVHYQYMLATGPFQTGVNRRLLAIISTEAYALDARICNANGFDRPPRVVRRTVIDQQDFEVFACAQHIRRDLGEIASQVCALIEYRDYNAKKNRACH
jgi:hypothetical protein